LMSWTACKGYLYPSVNFNIDDPNRFTAGHIQARDVIQASRVQPLSTTLSFLFGAWDCGKNTENQAAESWVEGRIYCGYFCNNPIDFISIVAFYLDILGSMHYDRCWEACDRSRVNCRW
jgi:hypothetical protein